METQLSPIEQQRQAKLNLLILDDDNKIQDQRQPFDDVENWGRSLETQTYLKQKLSQRYKIKRKSQRQLRSLSSVNNQCKPKKQITNDKQSLKELLKKLDSKQMKPSNAQTLRNSMVVEFKKLSKDRNWVNKNKSNRSGVQKSTIDNRSMRRMLKQIFSDEQNNFISKKIEILPNKKSINEQNLALVPIDKVDKSLIDLQGQSSYNVGQIIKRRQYLTESKQQKRVFKGVMRKNTQNKENEVLGFLQFPLDPYKNIETIKNSILIPRRDMNRTGLMQKDDINKKTFQILQQINRTKSINNVKKLTSQSLKLKKPQLCPYSRALKDKGNYMEEHNRSKNSIMINSSKDNIWVKLQIRK